MEDPDGLASCQVSGLGNRCWGVGRWHSVTWGPTACPTGLPVQICSWFLFLSKEVGLFLCGSGRGWLWGGDPGEQALSGVLGQPWLLGTSLPEDR